MGAGICKTRTRELIGASVDVRVGSNSEVGGHTREVRSTPVIGHRPTDPACPKGADSVEKVENRTTLKISRKSIFRRLYRYKAL
jgi:hypothetical protein